MRVFGEFQLIAQVTVAATISALCVNVASASFASTSHKAKVSPKASPIPPENSAIYYCIRHSRSPDTTPEFSAEATIRVDVPSKPLAEIRETGVPATATLFHLKLFTAMGTIITQRTKLVAQGLFDIELNTQRKGHRFASSKINDRDIIEVVFDLTNKVSDPSFIRFVDGRSFFMQCRKAD